MQIEAMVITFLIVACGAFVIIRQQRTIDKLTDKLMAKDYNEYKRGENVTQPVETKMRKKVSFYDDPSIELDEENIN
jgi:large-conductance mechanosensitive channel